MKKLQVCLDAGHGGIDNGASANAIIEDAWALGLCERIGHYIRARGGEAIFTRTGDTRILIDERPRIAIEANCDVFLSIHCNAAGNVNADGCEAFYAPAGNHQGNSKAIAESLLKACIKAGLEYRGVKKDNQSNHTRLGVLRGSCAHMPAVLLEVGFVSNKHDSKLMKDKVWRENLASAIADVLI